MPHKLTFNGRASTRSPRIIATRFVVFAAVLASLALSSATGNSSGDTIRLKAEAFVTGDEVRLGDIATFEGERASALSDVIISTSTGDQPTTLHFDAIKQALTNHDVNWAFISLGGFERCEIRRGEATTPSTSRPASPSLRHPSPPAANNGAVQASSAGANVTGPVTISSPEMTLRDQITAELAKHAMVPIGELRLTFNPSDESLIEESAPLGRYEVIVRSRQKLGRIMIGVRAYESERFEEKWNVVVELARNTQAVIARRPIARGAHITAQDIELRDTVITDGSLAVATSLDEALGKETSQAWLVGEVMDMNKVSRPFDVKRNDLVDVEARLKGFKVQFKARAIEDGVLGQTITIRRLGDRVEYDAVIVGTRSVQILSDNQRQVSQAGGADETAEMKGTSR